MSLTVIVSKYLDETLWVWVSTCCMFKDDKWYGGDHCASTQVWLRIFTHGT